MKNLIISTVYILSTGLAAAQAPAPGVPDMPQAIERLLSYGIINEEPRGEYDDSVEILQHFTKYSNQDEGINEFPYCVRLIEAGGQDNKLPVSCLRPFVEAGATIQGKDGDTSPLQAAAEAGNTRVLLYLIEEGADIHYADAAMNTALDYALMDELSPEHCEVARELLKRYALPTPFAMSRAARFHPALLQEMLHYGGTPSGEVLNAAVWNAESLELLLANGANIYGCAENGTTVTRALLQRISTSRWQPEELTHIVDILVAHQAAFYCADPREEIEIMLPDDMPQELRERLLSLYTSKPQPTFPETEESDVEEVNEEECALLIRQ